MDFFPWILWLHIFGAIVAFGPTYTFSLIGSMGGKEPMHANFATRITEKIERGIVLPLAVVQGITGLTLLLMSGRNLAVSTNYWLSVAIVLYVIALGFSYFGQLKRVQTVVYLSSTPPPPPAPGVAPSGPPPALLAAVKAVQQGGIFLTVLIVSIIFLMVVKPGS